MPRAPVKRLKRQLKKATDDALALSDLKHIIGATRREDSDESVTYAPAKHFTDMLSALKGQCLDFRANRNSVGNFVYLPSYADRDRMVITAQDDRERAPCNAPIALYVVDRAGEKKPANKNVYLSKRRQSNSPARLAR